MRQKLLWGPLIVRHLAVIIQTQLREWLESKTGHLSRLDRVT
jgi:hypothetical protein